MTQPRSDSTPIYVATVVGPDGKVGTEYRDLADLSVDTLFALMQHGDPRAADELQRRANHYALEQGSITQAEFDDLMGGPPSADQPTGGTPSTDTAGETP